MFFRFHNISSDSLKWNNTISCFGVSWKRIWWSKSLRTSKTAFSKLMVHNFYLKCKITNLLFDYLSLCCYSEAVTFQNVNEETVKSIENFIRIELQNELNDWKADDDQLILHEKDFYGSFHRSPGAFKFSDGEITLIGELCKYTKNMINKRGVKYFALGKKQKINFDGTFVIKNEGRYFTKYGTAPAEGKIDFDKLRREVHEKACAIFIRGSVDRDKVELLTMENTSVHMNDDNSIGARITCILCDESDDNKNVQINSTRGRQDQVYWTFSNLTKHLKFKHSIESTDKVSQTKSRSKSIKKTIQKNIRSDSECNSENDYITVVTSAGVSIEKDSEQKSGDFIVVENSNIPNAASLQKGSFHSDDMNESKCIELSIECSNKSQEMSHKTLDNIIYEKLSAQTLKMYELFLQSDERVEEMNFIHSKSTYSLDVVSIPPDGNCLFGALAHQLFGYKTDSTEHKIAVDALRGETVAYIRNNRAQFQKELEENIFYLKEKEMSKRRKIKIDDFEKESDAFLLNVLAKDKSWAGSESIKAVSVLKKVNIFVVTEENEAMTGINTFYFASGFNASFEGILMIAYRMNKHYGVVSGTGGIFNHYDSIVNIEAETILEISEKMTMRESEKKFIQSEVISIDDSDDDSHIGNE